MLFDANVVKKFIRRLSKQHFKTIDDMWFGNENKFNAFCALCFHRASDQLKTLNPKSERDANEKLEYVLQDHFTDYMVEFTRTISDAHESLETKCVEGQCAICINEGCDSTIWCCHGGVHRACYEEYRMFQYIKCPFCRSVRM